MQIPSYISALLCGSGNQRYQTLLWGGDVSHIVEVAVSVGRLSVNTGG